MSKASRARAKAKYAAKLAAMPYAGFTCRKCKHEDMVHYMWAGCCGIPSCTCEGMDGASNCHKDTHGPDCWWLKAKASA